jgi:two-component system, OmpR family, response regulator VicR
MNKTILVVDDEKSIVELLSFNLRKEGYNILTAYDGEKGLQIYKDAALDLILLDVMLPKLNGFEVCSIIRKTDFKTPIIMLTAREEETDKVLGLELGADDYITKPFSIREVMARVKANIRRTVQSAPPEEMTADGIVIDLERYDVYIDGESADLTQREFELFRFISSQPGKVYSREELLREVWQYEYLGDLRSVDVAVRRLREKIEHDSAKPEHIMTKRGVGYYYET